MASLSHIYIISDPREGSKRLYIGQSISPDSRFKQHILESKNPNSSRTFKNRWIKSLCDKGLQPVFSILDTVNIEEIGFWERHYISLFKSWGFELVNGTEGGEGSLGRILKDESRKKISVKNKGKTSARKGCRLTEEQKILVRIKTKEAMNNLSADKKNKIRETIGKYWKGRKRGPMTEVAKNKMRVKKLGVKLPAVSESNRRRWEIIRQEKNTMIF